MGRKEVPSGGAIVAIGRSGSRGRKGCGRTRIGVVVSVVNGHVACSLMEGGRG